MTRTEDGQSVIDLTVGSALLVLLAGVIVLILGFAETGFGAASSRSSADLRARVLLDGAARQLRSARPLGWCPTAPPLARYSTPADQCSHISDYVGWPEAASVPGGPILRIDPSDLWFWDYGDPPGGVAPAAPLGVPDCVEVTVAPSGDVLLNRWVGAGTFTTASCPGVAFVRGQPPTPSNAPTSSRLVGRISEGAPRSIFRATDVVGAPTTTPEEVVLVSIATTFTYTRGFSTHSLTTYPVEVDAAVRGTIYRRERAWNAS